MSHQYKPGDLVRVIADPTGLQAQFGNPVGSVTTVRTVGSAVGLIELDDDETRAGMDNGCRSLPCEIEPVGTTINGVLGRIIIDRKAEFTSIQVGHDAGSFTTKQVREVMAALADVIGLELEFEQDVDPLWDRPAKVIEAPEVLTFDEMRAEAQANPWKRFNRRVCDDGDPCAWDHGYCGMVWSDGLPLKREAWLNRTFVEVPNDNT